MSAVKLSVRVNEDGQICVGGDLFAAEVIAPRRDSLSLAVGVLLSQGRDGKEAVEILYKAFVLKERVALADVPEVLRSHFTPAPTPDTTVL